jgi:hypothetical protein
MDYLARLSDPMIAIAHLGANKERLSSSYGEHENGLFNVSPGIDTKALE